MELIVDANVLLSALIKKGITREIILTGKLQLYAPEFLMGEIEKHIEIIHRKSDISKDDLESFIKGLFTIGDIRVFATPEVDSFMSKAKKICPDPDDKDYFALALKLECPIWSNDKELKKQDSIKVYTTEEILELIQRG
jgi:predicted nucleic acid-binding protein